MVDRGLHVLVTKMEGKSWWKVTVRVAGRKYEGDVYMLGARSRIATLNERVVMLQSKVQQLSDELYDYQDKYGVLGEGR